MGPRKSILVVPNVRIENNRYKLHIPAHKLIITNPEQIAVLTGI